jgi:hypothetical protein
MSKLYRPTLDKDRQRMLAEIQDMLNERALFPFSLHDTLNLVVDRAYIKAFPGRQCAKRKKKYIELTF